MEANVMLRRTNCSQFPTGTFHHAHYVHYTMHGTFVCSLQLKNPQLIGKEQTNRTLQTKRLLLGGIRGGRNNRGHCFAGPVHSDIFYLNLEQVTSCTKTVFS